MKEEIYQFRLITNQELFSLKLFIRAHSPESEEQDEILRMLEEIEYSRKRTDME